MELLIHAEGASETDLRRGVAAAQQVFQRGRATAHECALAASQRDTASSVSTRLADLWYVAEKAAIAASCARLPTVPPNACLELRFGDLPKAREATPLREDFVLQSFS